nr:hypothetical protein HUO10_005119 [Paraburkholderia busanensis]
MHIKNWLNAMRRRRASIDASHHMPELPLDVSATSAWRKTGAFATIVVAAGLAIAASRFMAARAEPRRVLREFQTSQDCAARYAALLDLAELARRDGKASEVMMRGLNEPGGAMSACLSRVKGTGEEVGAGLANENAPDS